jgi:hypothetical protein
VAFCEEQCSSAGTLPPRLLRSGRSARFSEKRSFEDDILSCPKIETPRYGTPLFAKSHGITSKSERVMDGENDTLTLNGW